MIDHLNSKRTGRTRLKPQSFRVGWFVRTVVLVHQSEITFLATSHHGGQVDCETRTAWVPTKPEWLLENQDETS